MRLPRMFAVIAAAVALAWPAAPSAADDQPMWKVGAARVKITPVKPIWLAGYRSRNHPADGTLQDLWVKAIALEDAKGERGVVVTSDLLGIPQPTYNRLVDAVKARCDLKPAQVMFTTSHTHTGPVLEAALPDGYPLDDQQRRLIREYTHTLEQTIVETVVKALAHLEPATLWASEGTATFAVNRRNNLEPDVPRLRAQGIPLKGPVDQSVPVLAVRAAGGQLRAVVFGYACHCNVLNTYEWSGDYAGFTQSALETSYPGTQAMFWQGCGADQNPLPRRTVELCREYGQMLANSVEDTLAKPMRPVAPSLQTRLEFVPLLYDRQPTVSELEKVALLAGYRGRWAKRLLGELADGKTFPKQYDRYPVEVWKLGQDQLWIALGGETVVDYAIAFKQKFGPQTWITGYTNDVMAYIPSRRICHEGRYEAGGFLTYGLPARTWKDDIQDRITARVQKLVDELH